MYELADPSISREEAGACAFLVELQYEITGADALGGDDAHAASAECGGAPEPPPPVDTDTAARQRVDQLESLSPPPPIEWEREWFRLPTGGVIWRPTYLNQRQSRIIGFS